MTSIITRPFGDPPPIIFSEQPIIPGSDDDNFRSMVLVRPFIDPVNTFRAQIVEDMFFIVPDRREFSRFEFDVGLDPEIKSFIFSIQNKTVNTTLRVKLTLPSYLRSSLSTEFLVPFIGDTTTPPIVFLSEAEREARVGTLGLDPRITDLLDTGRLGSLLDEPPVLIFEGTGKGLTNVTITFSEAQAKTFNPGNIIDDIVFDIFPNEELTGPVFVSTVITPPKNLNIEEGEFPVDDDLSTGSIEPEVITITETIEVPVEVPVPTPAFIAGADGVTNEGVSFNAGDQVPGPPPTGWTTEADGRAYPPIVPELECDPLGESDDDDGDDDDGTTLTPLQQLVKNAESVPLSFGGETKRRGFVVDAKGQLTGNDPGRVSRRTVEHIVADSVPGKQQFVIVARSPKFVDGTSIRTSFFGGGSNRDYFNTVNIMTATIKEGKTLGIDIGDSSTFRNFALSRIIKNAFDNNDDLVVPQTLSSAELQTFRIAATTLGLLRELRQNGPGS